MNKIQVCVNGELARDKKTERKRVIRDLRHRLKIRNERLLEVEEALAAEGGRVINGKILWEPLSVGVISSNNSVRVDE